MVPHEQPYANCVNSGLLLIFRSEARTSADGHTEGVQSPKDPCRIQLLSSHIQPLAQYYGTYSAQVLVLYSRVYHRPAVYAPNLQSCSCIVYIDLCLCIRAGDLPLRLHKSAIRACSSSSSKNGQSR